MARLTSSGRRPGPRGGLGGVVIGDEAAQRDARVPVQQLEHRRLDGAANVLEIHVDTPRTGRREVVAERGALVVDARVEPELVDDVRAFVRRAGHAHGAAVLDPRDLADDRPHRARRRGHHDRLARRRLPDVEQPDVRRHPRHAEHADRGRNRQQRIELPQIRPLRHADIAPAVVPGHEIAHGERGIARLDDLADGVADHRLADRHRRRVRRLVAHPPAHVGIEREIEGTAQDIAVSDGRRRCLDNLEVVRPRAADGTTAEEDLAHDHLTAVRRSRGSVIGRRSSTNVAEAGERRTTNDASAISPASPTRSCRPSSCWLCRPVRSGPGRR